MQGARAVWSRSSVGLSGVNMKHWFPVSFECGGSHCEILSLSAAAQLQIKIEHMQTVAYDAAGMETTSSSQQEPMMEQWQQRCKHSRRWSLRTSQVTNSPNGTSLMPLYAWAFHLVSCPFSKKHWFWQLQNPIPMSRKTGVAHAE